MATTIRLDLTPDEAHHLVEALFVASDVNEGNENTAPDGRSWEEFTRAIAVRAREAALAAGLVSADEEYSLARPIVPGPRRPGLPAPPTIIDQAMINRAYRRAREAGDDAANARARLLLDERVSEIQADAAVEAYDGTDSE